MEAVTPHIRPKRNDLLALKTGRIYLWVPRQWIVDVHYLAEGFEGLLVASTLDRKTGLVQLTVAPGQEETALDVVEQILRSHPGIRLAQRTQGVE